ncbi:MAG: hypothetical protein ABSG08_11925 [Terriglobales bacterium]|jgi:hypothetical protein
MFIARALPWLLGMIVTCGAVSAQTCKLQAADVDSTTQKIERDKKAIRSLGFNIDAAAFDSLANASAEQRNQMAKTAYDNLIGAVLDAIGESAKRALNPQVNLPNGYASLNPVNVNAVINRLDNPSGPVASLLKQVASTSEKSAKLTLLRQLPDAVAKEQAAYDIMFGDASKRPRSLEAYLNLTRVLADLFDLPLLSKTLQIGTSGADTIVAYANLYYGSRALAQLDSLTESKAQALVKLDYEMKADVKALQIANAKLKFCTDCQNAKPLRNPPLAATNHFVTPDGAGDKSGLGDWTHACAGFSGACSVSSLTCGDTYYVAGGGTYAAINTNDCSEASTIIGATAAGNGTSNGWAPSMSVDKEDGGSQARWNCCLRFGNNWTWDGVAGPLWSNDTTAYGFLVITPADCNSNGHSFLSLTNNTTTGVTIRHVAATGCGPVTNSSSTNDLWDYAVVFGSFGDMYNYNHGNTIGNSYLVNFNSCVEFIMANNDTMEYNYCNGNWTTPANHGVMVQNSDGSQGGNVYRYNHLTNATGSGVFAIFAANGSPCGGNAALVYGNLIESNTGGDGDFVTGGYDQAWCNSRFYINTIVNSRGAYAFYLCMAGGSGCAAQAGNTIDNNLIYSSAGGIQADGDGAITHDYNACFSCISNFASESHKQIVSGDPFVNAEGNFQLNNAPGTDCSSTTTVCSGLNVSDTVNVDVCGHQFGSNGNWERGAFAFVGTATVNPPTGLAATVQ